MRGERKPTKGHFGLVLLRQHLVRQYGWTYEEVNTMRIHDAEVAALMGRHGRSRDRQLIEGTLVTLLGRRGR